MNNHLHNSPVRFTDEKTLNEFLVATQLGMPMQTKDHTSVGRMFDRTKVLISSLMDPPEPKTEIGERGSNQWNETRAMLAERIEKVILVLLRFIDLRSNEWKNAPLIWEMLSFDEVMLHDANTPLPESLREAMQNVESLLPEHVSSEELMNDIDEVIHQTYGRRTSIERVLATAVNTDLADTPLLRVNDIPHMLGTKIMEDMERTLTSVDQGLSIAAAEAICRACNGETAETFSVTIQETIRMTGEEAMDSSVGDVYLVRSKNVGSLGDHYIVIIGEPVQKPHGLRPKDLSFPIHDGEQTPLKHFDPEEPLVLLKLNDKTRRRFYIAYNVPEQYRRP